jgi:hypothetical protein
MRVIYNEQTDTLDILFTDRIPQYDGTLWDNGQVILPSDWDTDHLSFRYDGRGCLAAIIIRNPGYFLSPDIDLTVHATSLDEQTRRKANAFDALMDTATWDESITRAWLRVCLNHPEYSDLLANEAETEDGE